MLHTFESVVSGDVRYFLFESENSSLLEIERPVFLYIKKTLSKPMTEAELTEYASIKDGDIAEIQEELQELKSGGVIGVPELHVEPKKPDGLKALCLNVCHDCNLRCPYCFASQGNYNTPKAYMTFETGKAAVDFLIERSGKRRNLEIDFFGGEPLMNLEVVKKIVEYTNGEAAKHGKNISFTMTTNGLLLNGGTSEYLNATMENVVISIDGRPKVHDALRKTPNGKGSFDTVLKNALAFRAVRGSGRYYIRGTYTRSNLDFGKDILFLNDSGFDQISLEPVVLAAADPLAIRKEDVAKISAEYESFAAEYLLRRKNGKWFNFFHFMTDLENGPCIYKRLNGCGAGDEYIAVTPSGDIYPCHQFIGRADYIMGSVLDGTIDGALKEKFRSSNVYSKDKCGSCFAKYFCSGGCMANSVIYENDINKTNEIYCGIMKKRLEISLSIQGIERRDGRD